MERGLAIMISVCITLIGSAFEISKKSCQGDIRSTGLRHRGDVRAGFSLEVICVSIEIMGQGRRCKEESLGKDLKDSSP